MLVSEPVRVYLYGVLVALAAVLVAYGVLTEELSVVWLLLAEAILGVPAVESARRRVTPVEG